MADVVYRPPFDAVNENYSKAKLINFERICILYGTRIIRTGIAVDDNEGYNIYSVPEGKIFLLVAATLSIASNDTTRRTSYIAVKSANNSLAEYESIALMTVSSIPGGNGSVGCSFSVPLILNYGETLAVWNKDTDATTSGSISGYEIDAAIFYSLL